MNKWTMWLTGSGLSLLFVAIAVALAHRDSRNEIDPVSTTPVVETPSAAPVTLAWENQAAERTASANSTKLPSSDAASSSSTSSLESNPNAAPAGLAGSSIPATHASTNPTVGLPSFGAFDQTNNDQPQPNQHAGVQLSGTNGLPPAETAIAPPPAHADQFVQLANYQSSDEEVIRGNDEPPTGQPTPAAPPAAPLMSPFPFTKSPSSSAPATATNNTATAPAAEMAQLPTLPQAIKQTEDGLKKVADQAAETMSGVGQALDPRRAFGATQDPPAQPRTLSAPPASGLSTLLPQAGNSPAFNGNNTPPAKNQPPATLGAPAAGNGLRSLPAGNNTLGNNSLGNPAGAAPPVATFGAGNPPTNGTLANRNVANSSIPDNYSSQGGPNSGGFSSGRSTIAANTALASASPGERGSEGPQAPSLQLTKRAPEEVRIGRPATFTMTIKNVGTALARQVQVIDVVPNGTQFVAAQPPIQPDSNGELVWDLGDLPPGNERIIQLQLLPEAEGEIGSVASVTFAAVAGVRTLATQPKLVLSHNVVEQVLLSKNFYVQLKLTNEGSGAADNVSLEADLPANLKCSAGSQIVANIKSLKPGESKTIDLPLQAIDPGEAQIQLRVLAEDEEFSNQSVSLMVTAPQLQVAINGPTKRFIERQARYSMKVENVGNASATNLDLIVQLPKGFRFNGTGQKGQYDAARHAVLWSLEELPAGIAAEVELDVIPVEMGNQPLLFQATADLNAQSKTEATINVEGLSELSFSIADDNDPVEIDGETTYNVKVSNSGTRADAQVQLVVELPRGATLVGEPEGPAQSTVTGNQIVFAPLASMKAKDEVEYQFTIRWTEEGQQILRARVTSQNRSVPVTQEESTEVILDR
jgi:uncharacterized repeat protein (TIGR01451 family)